jgi:hypothetical protein
MRSLAEALARPDAALAVFRIADAALVLGPALPLADVAALFAILAAIEPEPEPEPDPVAIVADRRF